MATKYDVIVVGGGIEGSSSAYTLAKKGQKVLLLEQFPLPHTRGSSAGHSRITRYAYEEDFYVQMMVDAFPLWDQLAKEADSNLFVPCGALDIRTSGSDSERHVIDALSAHNITHEVLTSSQVTEKFPMIKTGGNDQYGAVWDPSGGLLRSDKCLAAYQAIFKRLGGEIRDSESVTSLIPGAEVIVLTTKGRYTASKVVIATGAWTGPIASSLHLKLPLKPIRISVLYWQVKSEYLAKYGDKNWPCVLDSRSGQTGHFHVYGLPVDEYPGLIKMCLHDGPQINPDHRDDADAEWIVDTVSKYVSELLPFVDSTKPVITESCIYTVTPDAHPFIDRHPEHSNVVICAGFSGHGFKLAPAVGKAVSELLLHEKSAYNMEPFRLNRFSPEGHNVPGSRL